MTTRLMTFHEEVLSVVQQLPPNQPTSLTQVRSLIEAQRAKANLPWLARRLDILLTPDDGELAKIISTLCVEGWMDMVAIGISKPNGHSYELTRRGLCYMQGLANEQVGKHVDCKA